MKLVGLPVLFEFCQRHADCQQAVSAWIAEVKSATWQTPNDIKARYSTASFLSDNRVVFNIKGNRYRLGVKIYYAAQTVIVKQAATHAEYDDWDF